MKALLEFVRGFDGQPQLFGEALQRIAFIDDPERCIEDFIIREDAHGWGFSDIEKFFTDFLGGKTDECLSKDELKEQMEEGGLQGYSFEEDGLAIDVFWVFGDGGCGMFFRVWHDGEMIAAVVYDSLDKESPWSNFVDWHKKNNLLET